MDTMLLRLFQSQILLQCKYVLYAWEDLNAAMRAKDIDRLFYSIQNILTASSNISKALWGQGGRLSDQRKPIRGSFGVAENSPLRPPDRMRNNFEHFDRQLDTWWKRSKNHNYLDHNIGSKTAVSGYEKFELFRIYDPKTTEVIFWENSFNIQQIVNEIQRFLPRLEEEVAKPHWDPPWEEKSGN